MQTPFSVTAVDSKLIENSSAGSLSDVMRYAATVGGTDNFGNAGEFFSSRGFQLAAGKNYFRDGLRYCKYGQVPLYNISSRPGIEIRMPKTGCHGQWIRIRRPDVRGPDRNGQ